MIPKKRIPTIEYKRRIYEAVEESEFPIDVENVRSTAGLGNWESTKALLMELALEGRIVAQRTTKGWVFTATSLPVQQLQR